MPVTQTTRVRWTAGRDGVAHAHRGSRAIRTVCGSPPIDERFGWPANTRCPACQAALVGEPTEGEQNELWGK